MIKIHLSQCKKTRAKIAAILCEATAAKRRIKAGALSAELQGKVRDVAPALFADLLNLIREPVMGEILTQARAALGPFYTKPVHLERQLSSLPAVASALALFRQNVKFPTFAQARLILDRVERIATAAAKGKPVWEFPGMKGGAHEAQGNETQAGA